MASLNQLYTYGQLGKLLLQIAKKGREDFSTSSSPSTVDSSTDDNASDEAKKLVLEMQKLGPTVIKFGQLLSSRKDLLPPGFGTEFQKLQDKVEPVPFSDMEVVLVSEFGVPIKKLFKSIEKTPIATASLGQVHKAVLMDGQNVAIKIQKPGVARQTQKDIESLEKLGAFLEKHSESFRRYDIMSALKEFKKNILTELDYEEEANNLIQIRSNLKEFHRLALPKVHESYTTNKVLTMDYLPGENLSDLSGIAKTEVDGPLLLNELFKAYLKQIFVDGIFHSDPHLGNMFLLRSEGYEQLGIVDLGMVTRIDPKTREKLLQFIINYSEGNAKEASELAASMSCPIEDVPGNIENFTAEVANLIKDSQGRAISKIKTGNVLFKVVQLGAKNGLAFPQEMTSIGRTLIYLDEVAHILDPNFNPQDAVKANAMEYMQKSQRQNTSLAHLFYEAVELKNLAEDLPRKANSILERILKGNLEVKVNAFDQEKMMQGFQKIANRVASGLILAAMIVAASRLMNLESSFTILGHPGPAMILLILASAGCVTFLAHVLFGDD